MTTLPVSSTMKRANTIVQMALMLALACVLGVVFNNAHPLGLRAESPVPAWTNPPPVLQHDSVSITQAIRIVAPDPATLVPVIPVNPAAPVATNPPPALAPPVVAPHAPHAPHPPPPAPAPPRIGNVTWPQAKEQLADGRTVLVDARQPSYYQAGHIPNAVSLPAQSSADAFAAFAAKYPPATTPLIIYCGAEQCHLSQNLATLLTTQHGFVDVKVLSGGFNEYVRALAEEQAKAAQKK